MPLSQIPLSNPAGNEVVERRFESRRKCSGAGNLPPCVLVAQRTDRQLLPVSRNYSAG